MIPTGFTGVRTKMPSLLRTLLVWKELNMGSRYRRHSLHPTTVMTNQKETNSGIRVTRLGLLLTRSAPGTPGGDVVLGQLDDPY